MASDVQVVVLAAGQGKRMHSDLPKVLHPIGGRPMLAHVLDTAAELGPKQLAVVYGHGGARVREAFAKRQLVWVEQVQQLGTGHAVQQALPHLNQTSVVLVLYGDVPLIRASTLQRLVALAQGGRLAVLTTHLDDATGYGRIVRDHSGQVVRIVEDKDANAEEKGISEVNTGIMAVPAGRLSAWLAALGNHNAQGEYYLTDIIAMAVQCGVVVEGHRVGDATEVLGVNNRIQQAELERAFQQRQAHQLLLAGVTLIDPARLDVRGTLQCGRDVVIDANCVFEGSVVLGHGVRVGVGCVLKDAHVEDGAILKPYTVVDGAHVGRGAEIGPFSRLRPGARLADQVHIGNFVEVKNTTMGSGSKANHLTYLGDAQIGAAVNVGAGTITCNYDGANKHVTRIDDGAFIGSGVMLVAPVSVGAQATVGAGSTITKSVDAGALGLERSKQVQLSDWLRPVKTPKDAG